jgi:hypothetical protein
MYHPLKQGSGNILGFKIAGGILKKTKAPVKNHNASNT